MAERVTNDFATMLAAALSSSAATMTVAVAPPSDLAQVGGNFRLRIEDAMNGQPAGTNVEFVNVTNVNANLLTISRAVENADRFPAVSHAQGSIVTHVLTAAALTAIVGAAGGSGSGGPPSGAAGGVLGGTYPNPAFAVDMATQAELDAEASTRSTADSALGGRVSTLETGAAGTASTTALNAEVSARQAADTAETAARTTADTTMGARITTLENAPTIVYTEPGAAAPDPAAYSEGTIWIEVAG